MQLNNQSETTSLKSGQTRGNRTGWGWGEREDDFYTTRTNIYDCFYMIVFMISISTEQYLMKVYTFKKLSTNNKRFVFHIMGEFSNLQFGLSKMKNQCLHHGYPEWKGMIDTLLTSSVIWCHDMSSMCYASTRYHHRVTTNTGWRFYGHEVTFLNALFSKDFKNLGHRSSTCKIRRVAIRASRCCFLSWAHVTLALRQQLEYYTG